MVIVVVWFDKKTRVDWRGFWGVVEGGGHGELLVMSLGISESTASRKLGVDVKSGVWVGGAGY